MGNSDSAGTSTSTSTQSCSALGGQGVDGAWSLSDDDSIPLLYDLRPLSELINVVTFPEADHNAALRLNAARNILEREINARLAVAGNLSSSPLRREGRAPQVWDIMVTEVKCVFTGDPNAQIGTIDVLGRISAEFKDVRGTIPLQLFGTQFDLSAGKEAFKFQPMTCGGMNSAGIPVNQTVRLLVRPDERGDGNFRFSVDNLVKYQPAKNAGVDTAYVLSRGWWVSFSILDAVLGPNTITPGGLAKGLDNEIDKLRGDVLGSSRRIVTNSTIEHYVLPAQPVGWQSPNVIFHQIGGGAGGEPLLWVGYTMKRIE
jgi:hypothetical protein